MTEILATSVIYDSFPPKAMSEEHTLAETTVSLGITKVGLQIWFKDFCFLSELRFMA